MVVVDDFWPHIFQTFAGNVWTDLCACEDQPNSKGKTITLADRTDFVFTSLVFLKKPNTVRLLPGQKVRVLGTEGEERISGVVSRFSFDKFSQRVWI